MPAAIKVSKFEEFPAKGRATGGVRCAALPAGEDRLTLAWVGGARRWRSVRTARLARFPTATAKRDASGQALDAVIGSIGRTLV